MASRGRQIKSIVGSSLLGGGILFLAHRLTRPVGGSSPPEPEPERRVFNAGASVIDHNLDGRRVAWNCEEGICLDLEDCDDRQRCAVIDRSACEKFQTGPLPDDCSDNQTSVSFPEFDADDLIPDKEEEFI